eukprot:363781-Chlamydomonas_euryale.AAC.13
MLPSGRAAGWRSGGRPGKRHAAGEDPVPPVSPLPPLLSSAAALQVPTYLARITLWHQRTCAAARLPTGVPVATARLLCGGTKLVDCAVVHKVGAWHALPVVHTVEHGVGAAASEHGCRTTVERHRRDGGRRHARHRLPARVKHNCGKRSIRVHCCHQQQRQQHRQY